MIFHTVLMNGYYIVIVNPPEVAKLRTANQFNPAWKYLAYVFSRTTFTTVGQHWLLPVT